MCLHARKVGQKGEVQRKQREKSGETASLDTLGARKPGLGSESEISHQSFV